MANQPLKPQVRADNSSDRLILLISDDARGHNHAQLLEGTGPWAGDDADQYLDIILNQIPNDLHGLLVVDADPISVNGTFVGGAVVGIRQATEEEAQRFTNRDSATG